MEVSPKIRRIALSLAGGQGQDVDPAAVARKVGAACRAIDAALTPIIGHKGVEALCKRSLHVAARAHPWLASESVGAGTAESLVSSLSAQGGVEAATGGAAFLQAFYDLLTSLLGASLTERLLRSIWIDFLDDTLPQDPVP
ncbi:MAG TPA: hypothetical protein VNU71_21675 [Burkholderiaceae bacterium]|nr:hypothetical protein [Burkholderiaceae bacterium]